MRTLVLPLLALLLVIAAQLYVQPAEALDFDTGLLVTTRSRLAVCVEPVGQNVGRAAVAATIRTHLEALRRLPVYAEARYDIAPFAVAAGCPAQPALLASGDASDQNGGPQRILAVGKASPYRTMVFVVPEADVWRMFGNGYPLHAQESICAGSDCYEVTTALY